MRAIRIFVVMLVGALEIAAFLTTVVTYTHPVGEFGYNVGTDGMTVTAVEPKLPAARAGLQPGDRLVFESLSRIARLNVLQDEFVEPGTVVTARVVRGQTTRTISMTAQGFPELSGAGDLSFAIGGLALGLVSLGLVLVRPSRMTWGFVLVAPPLLVPTALYLWAQLAPDAIAVTFQIGVALLYGLQALGTLTFAARFPTDVPRGIAKWIDRAAIPLGVLIAAIDAYVATSVWLSAAAPPAWILASQDYVSTGLTTFAALVALCFTYAASERNVRNRLTPTIAAFVLLIVTEVVQQYASQWTSNPGQLLALDFTFAAACVIVMIAVAYGVARHRVIDADFIVSRTLVYTILTMFAVGVFALIDYLVGKLLEEGRLASLLEIAAAVAIGISMNYLHGQLDRFIDLVLFRRRHLAEARLERAAAALPHAKSIELVEEMLVGEPSDAFELASAAVFRRRGDEDRYVRATAQGWSERHAPEMDGDDHLVVLLRAELQPVDISGIRWPRSDVPSGVAQPLYAVPLAVGHHLEAFALYSGHRSGEDLDPDERQSLRGLAGGGALAYGHLLAQALRKNLEEAKTENDALRKIEDKLTGLLEARLRDRA
jgi:hypothetical protein